MSVYNVHLSSVHADQAQDGRTDNLTWDIDQTIAASSDGELYVSVKTASIPTQPYNIHERCNVISGYNVLSSRLINEVPSRVGYPCVRASDATTAILVPDTFAAIGDAAFVGVESNGFARRYSATFAVHSIPGWIKMIPNDTPVNLSLLVTPGAAFEAGPLPDDLFHSRVWREDYVGQPGTLVYPNMIEVPSVHSAYALATTTFKQGKTIVSATNVNTGLANGYALAHFSGSTFKNVRRLQLSGADAKSLVGGSHTMATGTRMFVPVTNATQMAIHRAWVSANNVPVDVPVLIKYSVSDASGGPLFSSNFTVTNTGVETFVGGRISGGDLSNNAVIFSIDGAGTTAILANLPTQTSLNLTTSLSFYDASTSKWALLQLLPNDNFVDSGHINSSSSGSRVASISEPLRLPLSPTVQNINLWRATLPTLMYTTVTLVSAVNSILAPYALSIAPNPDVRVNFINASAVTLHILPTSLGEVLGVGSSELTVPVGTTVSPGTLDLSGVTRAILICSDTLITNSSINTYEGSENVLASIAVTCAPGGVVTYQQTLPQKSLLSVDLVRSINIKLLDENYKPLGIHLATFLELEFLAT